MAFFHNGLQGGGGEPYLKWTTKNTPGLAILRNKTPLLHAQIGKTLLVVDHPTLGVGWVTYEPKFHTVIEPYRTPAVSRPSNLYKPCVSYQTLVLGYTGILPWVIDAEYPMNKMGLYFRQYESFPEAAAGKVPVYRYIGNEPNKHPSYPSDTFYSPNFEIIDWMERPVEFGDATVPPKPLELPELEPPVALPPTPAPPPATNTVAEPFRPVPVPTPTPTSTPSTAPATPASDLLARFVRRT